MINIRCSSLQDVKQNAKSYAQMLHDGFEKNGGSRGMLAYWQDIAKQTIRGEITVNDGVKSLQQTFLRFADNKKNNQKREFLLDQLVKFAAQCSKRKFVWEEGQHRIKWELYAGVMLTGLTPIIVKSHDQYYSFIVAEHLPAWQDELRFPLFQQYLADYILDCRVEDINVGVFLLSKKDFEFKKYTADELSDAINETSDLFREVQTLYTNLLKAPK